MMWKAQTKNIGRALIVQFHPAATTFCTTQDTENLPFWRLEFSPGAAVGVEFDRRAPHSISSPSRFHRSAPVLVQAF